MQRFANNRIPVQFDKFANLVGGQRDIRTVLTTDMLQYAIQVKRLFITAEQLSELAALDYNHFSHTANPYI